MNKILSILFCFIAITSYSQNSNCNNPSPFCTSAGGYTFPAGVNAGAAQAGPNYGCLFSQPNPAWYFMQIQNPGTLTIDLNSTPYQDVDFICYGPFASLAGTCTAQLTAGNTVDCSYSASGYEQVNISNAQTGQFYVVLITNFSNQPCNINFNLVANQSTATTNCGILAGPVGNNGPICEGDTLQLTAQAVPGAIMYNWTGPGGFAANTQNVTIPNATPAMSGAYTLVVSDANGSAAPVATNVTVYPIPAQPSISSNGPICEGQTLNLSCAAVANATYSWTGPGGFVSALQNPSIPAATVAQSGNYFCNVTVNGCPSPDDTVAVVIHPNPTPIITGPHWICQGALSNLSTTLPYASYQWSDNTNLASTLVPAGNYTVTVIDTNNCTAVSAAYAVSYSLPTVQITGMQIYCEFQNLTLTASGGPYPIYLWSTGSGTNTAVTSGGQVWVSVTDSIGCKATDTVTTTPSPLPVPNFTFTNVCHLLPLPFVDNSTIPVGNVTAWDWNFGNAQTATGANVSNLFPSHGTFPVTLVATSNDGCKDSVTKTVTVHPLPVVAFTPVPGSGCVPLMVNFQNQSTIPSGAIVTYSWDLGIPGATSAIENPTKGYGAVDTFAVTLIAISDKGCSDTLTIPDAVKTWPNPDAEFSFYPEEIYMDNPTVNFTDLSIGATAWNWDFDDGNSSNFKEPVHLYEGPGAYNVHLYITNQYGCTDDIEHILVVQASFAIFIPNSFTPDGDGMNDFFFASGNGIVTYEMMIFDRWGQLITSGANISWDGRINGVHAKQESYIYKIKAYDVTGLEYVYEGFVNLVR